MKTAKIEINPADRLLLQRISSALSSADTAYSSLSLEVRELFEKEHNPNATLGYCLRWGQKAVEELIIATTPTVEAPIWVTPEQLATHLRIKVAMIKTLTQKKILIVWERDGKKYYDLHESIRQHKVWAGEKA